MRLLVTLFLVLAFTITTFLVSAEPRREPDYKLKRKNGLVFIVNEKPPYTGIIFNKYSNGQMASETTWRNGRPDGAWKAWYENGKLMKESNYKDSILDGVQKEWFENGQLKIEEVYKDGRYDGVWKSWDENGKLVSEKTYKDGKEVPK